MLEIAIIVMPVFLVVFAGYIAARVGLVSGLQTDALMHFTVHVAAPALLFNAVTSLDLGEAMRPTLLSAYYIPIIGMLLLGAFTICKFAISGPSDHRARLWRRKPSSDIGPDRRACADLLSCRRHSDGECAC